MMYLPESGDFGCCKTDFGRYSLRSDGVAGQTAVVYWKDTVFISGTKIQTSARLFYRNLMSMTSPAAGASVKTRLALGFGLML
jgi:hypothetical protein